MEFQGRYRELAGMVEESLSRRVEDEGGLPYQALADAVKYSLLSGGKRVRAVLLLAFYGLFRSDLEKATPFGCALEMVHAYSLVHDDLPCMDDDDMRRGKPSCHAAFGEATALLAGDVLLTMAFETGASCELPPALVTRCIRLLAEGAGLHGMAGGQAMDLDNEDKTLGSAELDGINSRKTGALFRAAAGIGCVLGGGTEAQVQAAERFADRIGLAFQIVDDILDVTSDAEALGKPVGSDADNRKGTYAALLGVEECQRRVEALSREAKGALEAFEGDTGFLGQLVDFLASRKF